MTIIYDFIIFTSNRCGFLLNFFFHRHVGTHAYISGSIMQKHTLLLSKYNHCTLLDYEQINSIAHHVSLS